MLEDPKIVEPFIEDMVTRLKDSYACARCASIQALAHCKAVLGDEITDVAAKMQRRAVNDEDPETRRASIEALRMLDQSATRTLELRSAGCARLESE